MKTKVVNKIVLVSVILTLVSCTQKSNIVIKFDSYGGTAVNSVSYSSVPTKKGFDVDRWYFDNNTFLRVFMYDSLIDEPIKKRIKVYAKRHPKYSN